jgi:hypothetical protein
MDADDPQGPLLFGVISLSVDGAIATLCFHQALSMVL